MNHVRTSKRIWVGTLIVVVAVSVGGSLIWKRKHKSESFYREVSVTRGDLENSIIATGAVAPKNRLEIKAPVNGRAESVLVDEGSHVKKGQILVWMSSTERAALLDAARARGPEELQKWEDYYKATPVLAPVTGTVIQRNVQPGQTFATSDAILVMSDSLVIQAQVDETDIAEIHLKQQSTVVLDAYPEISISAVVDKIAYDAKTVNNVTTYIVETLALKIPDFMRSGMTANVNFVTKSKKNILLLSSEAIKKRPNGEAFVLLRDLSDEKRTIEQKIVTGISDGKRSEIVSGLVENQKVLIPELKLDSAPSGSSPFSPFGSKGKSSH